MDTRPDIAELVRVAAEEQVSNLIAPSAWPTDKQDRRWPAAARWLCKWLPKHSLPLSHLPVCTCRAGRCGICN